MINQCYISFIDSSGGFLMPRFGSRFGYETIVMDFSPCQVFIGALKRRNEPLKF